MLTKQEVYALLEREGVACEIAEHRPVYTVEEAARLDLPHPEAGAKNLFLRDDKKRNYYLLVLRDDRPADLRAFQARAGTRRLSFASEEDLARLLGLRRGSVTPLGALNDGERRVRVYIDGRFAGGRIWVHPCDNTASVCMDTVDLVRLLETHGTAVTMIDL